MFNNCYRPGCHYDLNRCGCNRNWQNNCQNGYFKCCFPVEISFPINNNQNCFHNNQNNRYGLENDYYDRNNDQNYRYGFENNDYNRNNNQFYDWNEDYQNQQNDKYDYDCKDREKERNFQKDWNRDECKKERPDRCQDNKHRHNNCRCCLGILAGCLFGRCCR